MLAVFQRRVFDPIKSLLVQGVSPEKISLSLACGVVFGLFPVMGTTTFLCALVAVALGLNLPAIQAISFLIYPAQLALIVPFIRAGQFLLRSGPTSLTLAQMVALAHGGAGRTIRLLWHLAVAGIAAWMIFAPVALALLYWCILAAVIRLTSASSARRRSAEV